MIQLWPKRVRWLAAGASLRTFIVRGEDYRGVVHASAPNVPLLGEKLRRNGGFRLMKTRAPVRWGD